jgi:hypothetical protein
VTNSNVLYLTPYPEIILMVFRVRTRIRFLLFSVFVTPLFPLATESPAAHSDRAVRELLPREESAPILSATASFD